MILIVNIKEEAAGGVLVLMTSFSSIKKMTSMLPEYIRKILVVAKPEVSIREQRRFFLNHSKQGVKPLWLAVGGAWTGLDVGGHVMEPKIPHGEDNVLTDLVISKFPFGANRSMTHMARMQRNSTIQWELLDATFRTKQGIGRLVRVHGLPKIRRIFILDNRINDQKFIGFLHTIRLITRGYKTETFLMKNR